MSFDPSLPFTTRRGKPVTDFIKLSKPLDDGAIFAGVVDGDLLSWDANGVFWPRSGEPGAYDLVNAPPEVFATRERLLAALTPFAEAYRKASDPGTSDLDEQPFHITVSLGDLRRANLLVPYPKRKAA